MTSKKPPNDAPKSRAENHRFQFSSNRGTAKHRVRYVESGGGDSIENCRLCRPAVKPR